MWMTRLKTAIAALLVLGFMGLGAAALTTSALAEPAATHGRRTTWDWSRPRPRAA
jgi:hypothetical protein